MKKDALRTEAAIQIKTNAKAVEAHFNKAIKAFREIQITIDKFVIAYQKSKGKRLFCLGCNWYPIKPNAVYCAMGIKMSWKKRHCMYKGFKK